MVRVALKHVDEAPGTQDTAYPKNRNETKSREAGVPQVYPEALKNDVQKLQAKQNNSRSLDGLSDKAAGLQDCLFVFILFIWLHLYPSLPTNRLRVGSITKSYNKENHETG